MFYCQGGGPPNELWTVSQVLDALRPLSDIVNTSMRVKVLGPFAYKRDNGITAHPELMQAFTNIKAAAPPGVQLIPIGDAPVQPPIPPVQPPKPTTPYPAASVYARTTMSVTLFEHINYAGASQAVTGDTPDLRTFGAQWNDQASSIQMPAGTTVTLFQDINYGGASLVLTESATDLRNFPGPGPDGTWNDQASSMKVAGAGAGSGERLKVGSKYVECTGGLTCTLVSTKSDASKVMVTPHDDKHFDVLFTKANKTLSIQNDGGLQSRDAGTYGAFEQLDAVTTPKPSEVNLIFRTDAGGVVGGVVLQIVVEN
jgi:hypothetical protein